MLLAEGPPERRPGELRLSSGAEGRTRIFEVTREGEIVHELVSAMSEDRGAGSFRATRIPCLVGEI